MAAVGGASSAARSSSASRSSTSSSSKTRGTYSKAPSTKAAAESPRNSLQKGHAGQSVADMQRELNKAGANLKVDGLFGPKTDAAVKAFQANNGLAVDGKAGMNTLGKMYNDGRGADAYEGKTNGPAKKAPTPGQIASRPSGTSKAGTMQRPMNPVAPRQKPPAANAPGSSRPGAATVPKQTAEQAGKKAAEQQARHVEPSKATNTNPTPSKPGQPPNQTAKFDKVSKAGQRNQMVTGRITVNGKTYQFRSGGYGRGNLPKGSYEVTKHRYSRNDSSMSKVDGKGRVGYSYALSDKYDSRVKGTRTLLRIHPDGNGPGTMGCIGIVGNADVQRQFRADMQAELARNGGRFTLQVG